MFDRITLKPNVLLCVDFILCSFYDPTSASVYQHFYPFKICLFIHKEISPSLIKRRTHDTQVKKETKVQ